MATLSSPGVSVTVTDESFYASAEPGTIPLLVIATEENKLNGSATGVAPGTLKANAGEVYAISSQKELTDTFGDAIFKTDANNNPIHAGEQNEYGLQAAYSYLGVSNRAYVVRADIDLSQVNPTPIEPTNTPENGTYWFDYSDSYFGIFEWNGAPITTNGGQTFTNKMPIIINDSAKVDDGIPKSSVGKFGDYAVVTLTTANEIFFKNNAGEWVVVGSNEWTNAWPTVIGTRTAPSLLTEGDYFSINTVDVTVPASPDNTSQGFKNAINDAAILGVTASINSAGILELHNDGSVTDEITIAAGGSATPGEDGTVLVDLGLSSGVFMNPKLAMSTHTQIPDFKSRDANPRPTGSVWVKTTSPNLGANWKIKRFNDSAKLWENVQAPLYSSSHAAIFGLDKVGGGVNIPVGQVFVHYNFDENFGVSDQPTDCSFKPMRRAGVGETIIRSIPIATSTFTTGLNAFYIKESNANSAVLSDTQYVSFSALGTPNDANLMAGAINVAALNNVYAEVDSLNRVVIKHSLGGEFRLNNPISVSTDCLNKAGFSAYNPVNKTGTANLYTAPAGDVDFNFVASLWEPLSYTASADALTSLTKDGQLWYNSEIDQVDIMINSGTAWVGYNMPGSIYFTSDAQEKTDPMGPIVSASIPETQSDQTALVTGDLWIDTSDMENYPVIYKFNKELDNKPVKERWVKVDKSDQSSEEGVVFADARYNISGDISDVPGDIVDMLSSNFVDFDAPDPALYPKGMLLWNLRRSGFNVKKFVHGYVNTTVENVRYNDESMSDYYPHRWISVAANQEDGSGTFGRKAQRKIVVQELQALVNSNQLIRDEESRVFNLIACPGYPELIGEMISLNYDRGLTAFVIGDTPARLESTTTAMMNWATNQKLAVEDNDDGAPSHDEYMGLFYPWGYTSDNFGNNVVVPPSHMMLRTIALSDQASYPWFAPAGLRRGGITNATSVGYITSEGEFKSIALTEGQRDTLYDANVNPITFFAGSGLVNFGQKTRAKTASSLDRINVARLVIYLRRRLAQLAKPYIFEPNDKITRDELKATIESLLLELVGKRAITDYLVVCDTSNNTPTRIDRNELYADIAIVPTRAVEFIYIPIRLKNTGSLQTSQ